MAAKSRQTTQTTKPEPAVRWPFRACPVGSFTTAADLLNAIVMAAVHGRAPQLDRISMLVIRCAALLPGSADAKRCAKLEQAVSSANAGAWSKVTDILETLAKGTV